MVRVSLHRHTYTPTVKLARYVGTTVNGVVQYHVLWLDAVPRSLFIFRKKLIQLEAVPTWWKKPSVLRVSWRLKNWWAWRAVWSSAVMTPSEPGASHARRHLLQHRGHVVVCRLESCLTLPPLLRVCIWVHVGKTEGYWTKTLFFFPCTVLVSALKKIYLHSHYSRLLCVSPKCVWKNQAAGSYL